MVLVRIRPVAAEALVDRLVVTASMIPYLQRPGRAVSRIGIVLLWFTCRLGLSWAGDPPSMDLLTTDSLGKLVATPTNQVPHQLLPPDGLSITNQVPTLARGIEVPNSVRERQNHLRSTQEGLVFFPSVNPLLAPYLASQDDFGNSSLKAGALIPWTPFDVASQRAKYFASEVGLRYSLKQTITYVNLSEVQKGAENLAFYELSFASKWAVYDATSAGTAGWLSSQVKVKAGLGSNGATQSARSNLGSVTNPSNLSSSYDGAAVQELAWQESMAGGEVVVLAGVVNQSNYLDANTYANTARGQFLNSALVNSMVLPLPSYLPGLNLQWQPDPEWYFMTGGSAGTATAGQTPWTGFTWKNWSVVGEMGYAPTNFLGLGPGVFRIQPFVAQVTGIQSTSYTVTLPGSGTTTNITVNTTTNSPVQAGLGFNLQQQLGQDSPFGWFGRFGLGGSQVSAGAEAQIGTGFVMRGPLAYIEMFPSREQDGAGLGFVWSRPSATSTVPAHDNEFVLEAGYVLQLTPTAKLQPDLQVVWNPAYNATTARAVVLQLQLDLAW